MDSNYSVGLTEMESVMNLQKMAVETEELSLCLSMHSTTSTTNSWPTLKTK
ncbi:hypothetical protein H4F99_09525 [Lysobacter sp. SG-8]|uniref:Uncharacterized protein n=1 Tax=Marilutibacter penaei TaxID=2759900 RepID=A0A7W3U4D3_9GAMM|nr:hypothetical protein [Lysobacter penaei]MBB1088729.1 hypothetical protein [Lysobacter penaei]